MKKFGIGLQMYSVRDELSKDFEGTVRKVAEMGYEYVEFAGYYGNLSGEELKALLDKYGLKSVSVHQGLEMFVNEGQKAFDFFKAYGVKYIVIPWYDKTKLPGYDTWEETKKLFASVSDMAKANGMSLLYHNHDFEFEKKINGEYVYDIMFRELEGKLDPEPDVCWLNYGGVNPSEYLKKYGDRINVVHLKDFVCTKWAAGPVYALIDADGNAVKGSQADNGFKFKPVGQGVQKWDEIIAACSEIDADYLIVEQDNFFDGITPFEGVEASRVYLKNTLGI